MALPPSATDTFCTVMALYRDGGFAMVAIAVQRLDLERKRACQPAQPLLQPL
jgi:hypothetical protein